MGGPIAAIQPKEINPLAKVLGGGSNNTSDVKQSQDPTPNLSMGGGADSIIKKKKN